MSIYRNDDSVVGNPLNADVPAEISTIPEKAVPDPSDVFIFESSTDGFGKRRITFQQLSDAIGGGGGGPPF